MCRFFYLFDRPNLERPFMILADLDRLSMLPDFVKMFFPVFAIVFPFFDSRFSLNVDARSIAVLNNIPTRPKVNKLCCRKPI